MQILSLFTSKTIFCLLKGWLYAGNGECVSSFGGRVCVLRKCVVGRTEGGGGRSRQGKHPNSPASYFHQEERKRRRRDDQRPTQLLVSPKKRGEIERRKRRTAHLFPPLLGFYAFSGERFVWPCTVPFCGKTVVALLFPILSSPLVGHFLIHMQATWEGGKRRNERRSEPEAGSSGRKRREMDLPLVLPTVSFTCLVVVCRKKRERWKRGIFLCTF